MQFNMSIWFILLFTRVYLFCKCLLWILHGDWQQLWMLIVYKIRSEKIGIVCPPPRAVGLACSHRGGHIFCCVFPNKSTTTNKISRQRSSGFSVEKSRGSFFLEINWLPPRNLSHMSGKLAGMCPSILEVGNGLLKWFTCLWLKS